MDTIDTIRGYVAESFLVATAARRTRAALAGLGRQLAVLRERRRSRLALFDLNDQQLEDIGISRAEALKEAGRPFWDSSLGGHGR